MMPCRIVLVALAVAVSGCSTIVKETPVLKTLYVEREVPAAAKQTCAAPVVLPDRDLTDKETALSWAKDRTALRICETRRAAAVSGGSHVQ